MNCEVLSFEAVHVCGIFLVSFIYVSIDNLNQDHGVPCVKDRVVDVSFFTHGAAASRPAKSVFFSNCVDEARIIYRIIAKAELAEPIETQPQLT